MNVNIVYLFIIFEMMFVKMTTTTTTETEIDAGFRIMGGTRTEIENYPYMVSISTGKSYTRHRCGGTLINENWVLTAAHCLFRTEDDGRRSEGETAKRTRFLHWKKTGCRVLMGVTDLRTHDKDVSAIKRRCAKIIDHESYSTHGYYNYDIAMIKVDSPIKNMEFMKLAPSSIVISALQKNFTPKCVAVGWGRKGDGTGQSSPILLKTDMELMAAEPCREYFHPSLVSLFSNICGIQRDASVCQGDSGGPLICDGLQYGLVNYGTSCEIKKTMDEIYAPDCFARVDFYDKWIEDNVNSCPNIGFNFTFVVVLLYLSLHLII